jgi:hypothetical protein
MRKPTYTTKLHAHRLTIMMGKGEPCGHCPASRGFEVDQEPGEMWSTQINPCQVCRDFLITPNNPRWHSKCPCHSLGEEDAIKLTNKALNRYYKGAKNE